MVFTSGYYTDINQIQSWFDKYGEENPYWVLYAGEEIDARKRKGMNYLFKDKKQAWTSLYNDLLPFSQSGGVFLISLTDKPKDNAPTVTQVVKFGIVSPQFSQSQGQNMGIAGLPYMGYTEGAIQEKIELALLKREVEELRKPKLSGVPDWLSFFTSDPNFDGTKAFSEVTGLLKEVVSVGKMALSGAAMKKMSIATAQNVNGHNDTPVQVQETETAEASDAPHKYDGKHLAQSLDMIRYRLPDIRTEILLRKMAEFIANAEDAQLVMLIGAIGGQYDGNTFTLND